MNGGNDRLDPLSVEVQLRVAVRKKAQVRVASLPVGVDLNDLA